MNLNELAAKIHDISRAKGFWPKEPGVMAGSRNPFEVLALIHSEVSECLEAMRDDKWDAGVSWHPTDQHKHASQTLRFENGQWKYLRVDLNFNQSWELVTPVMADKWGWVAKPEGVPSELADILIRVLDAAAAWDIDIETAVQQKVDYNASREILHGRAR